MLKNYKPKYELGQKILNNLAHNLICIFFFNLVLRPVGIEYNQMYVLLFSASGITTGYTLSFLGTKLHNKIIYVKNPPLPV